MAVWNFHVLHPVVQERKGAGSHTAWNTREPHTLNTQARRLLETGWSSELPDTQKPPTPSPPPSHPTLRPPREFFPPLSPRIQPPRKTLGRCGRSGCPSHRASTAWRRPRSSPAAAPPPPSSAAPSSSATAPPAPRTSASASPAPSASPTTSPSTSVPLPCPLVYSSQTPSTHHFCSAHFPVLLSRRAGRSGCSIPIARVAALGRCKI